MVVRADFILIDQIPVQIIQLSVTLLHGDPTEGKRSRKIWEEEGERERLMWSRGKKE